MALEADGKGAPRMEVYRSSRLKEVVGALAIPVFSVLHRPIFHRAAEMAYDFALRWNGFAITFRGKHQLTRPEERFLDRFLPTVPRGLLLDVGANHGAYALYLRRLRPDCAVLAFEPHPTTFKLLKQLVTDPGIELVNLAVSDKAGTLKLYDFANNDGSTQASLSQDTLHLFDSQTVSYDVEVTTLDAFAAERGIERISFLKIDTEGFDINVLRGAARLLAEGRIGAIQFEFIPACIALRVTMRDFFEVLAGFRLYRLGVGGHLIPLRYDVKRVEVFVVQNIIALPEGTAPPR